MAKELKFVLFLDFYGDLLTENQRSIMEQYYCEDLSLAEIGQPRKITRQAVRSIIKRSEDILLNYEEKLGFAERLGKMRDCLENITAAATQITDTDLHDTIVSEALKGMELL